MIMLAELAAAEIAKIAFEAVIGESTGIPLGFKLFQRLWLPLFNPAISILIAGAIFSWAINKIQERLSPK